ncbi:uncharacterized protein DUF4873 [Jatrophihabitans sp. GAS493]|uniref:DUF4873 domain-containing protein n=1 Tax=Jatrophihabitans sp. GAS493 TaxID=1907575 RepID=UPI000BB7BB39|nr:DUF4873 domain-containing protein [Jatrophihabitans sp. GAS493]SOD72353.1 uncharacterized protein DUF4873 [Jatrophihabitans sp. GAS493]
MTDETEFSANSAEDGEPVEEGYTGPVELVGNGVAGVTVGATLTGHFDPLSGKYSWYGRLEADPAVAALVHGGTRRVTLRSPYAEVSTSLSDVDPWGRYRVEGFGAPPFEIAVDLTS